MSLTGEPCAGSPAIRAVVSFALSPCSSYGPSPLETRRAVLDPARLYQSARDGPDRSRKGKEHHDEEGLVHHRREPRPRERDHARGARGSKFAIEGLSEALAAEVAPLGIKITIVEPGLFRTEFLRDGSSRYAANTIPDYDATAGYVRRLMKQWDGTQANDPCKLARALVRLASSEQPPLRFTAGADAVEWLEEKLTAKRVELDRWRPLSVSLSLEASGQDLPRRKADLPPTNASPP